MGRDWKPCWRQCASAQAWLWRGTGQGFWHWPELLFLVQQKPGFRPRWEGRSQLSRSGSAESTGGLPLGLGSGDISSLPEGGVHWWQICRSCGRRSADYTASGKMAKQMFIGLKGCSQKPCRGKSLKRRWRNSWSLSLMQWQMESPRLGKAGDLWLLATSDRLLSPADLPLQNRFSAPVADDGEKILPRETSQLSLGYISTKKRWQAVAERGFLLREMGDPSTNLLSREVCHLPGAQEVVGTLPRLVWSLDNCCLLSLHTVVPGKTGTMSRLTLGIRMKGVQPICCLVDPDGEGERLD